MPKTSHGTPNSKGATPWEMTAATVWGRRRRGTTSVWQESRGNGHSCQTWWAAPGRTLVHMFSVFCPQHQSEVLLGNRGIERIVNDDHGIRVHWKCHCGHRGTLRTGTLRTGVAR